MMFLRAKFAKSFLNIVKIHLVSCNHTPELNVLYPKHFDILPSQVAVDDSMNLPFITAIPSQ
jgi:hypothetical protein